MFESKKEVIAGRREKDTPEVTPIRMCKGRHEHTWAARGCIIYFFLHQDLGNKNMKDICKFLSFLSCKSNHVMFFPNKDNQV